MPLQGEEQLQEQAEMPIRRNEEEERRENIRLFSRNITDEQKRYFDSKYNEWQDNESVLNSFERLEYLSRKEEAIANGRLGAFYKGEMLENLRYNSSTNCWETTIEGRRIVIGRDNIDNDFDPSSRKDTNYTLEQSREHVRTAIIEMSNEAIIGLANFSNYNDNLKITSMYRRGNDPHSRGEAIDFAMPENTPVYAAKGGVVIQTQVNPRAGTGIMIVIQGSDGLIYRYMHNNTLLYQTGQTVNAGDQITLSGNTGNSSGPHLHFDVR